MNSMHNVRRFRSNPVEVAIFSVVALIFFNSVYHLFYDHSGFTPIALTPMSSNPISEGRQLASLQQPLLNLELPCDDALERQTSANKLRFNGSFCGTGSSISPETLIKTSITNTANQFNATVFTDTTLGRFSTDYIPLKTGENLIRIEFAYQGGKSTSQNIRVTRN